MSKNKTRDLNAFSISGNRRESIYQEQPKAADKAVEEEVLEETEAPVEEVVSEEEQPQVENADEIEAAQEQDESEGGDSSEPEEEELEEEVENSEEGESIFASDPVAVQVESNVGVYGATVTMNLTRNLDFFPFEVEAIEPREEVLVCDYAVNGNVASFSVVCAEPGEYTLNIKTIKNSHGIKIESRECSFTLEEREAEEEVKETKETNFKNVWLETTETEVEQGQRIYFYIKSDDKLSPSDFLISANTGSITIAYEGEENGGAAHKYIVTSSETSQEAIDARISINSGTDGIEFHEMILDVKFTPSTFLDLPNITLSTDNINLSESDLPYEFFIKDMYGKPEVTSSHPKVKVSVEGNKVTVNAKMVSQDVTGNIYVTVPGQSEEIVNFRITPPREDLIMSCDKKTLRFQEGDKYYFNVPSEKERCSIDSSIGLKAELDETGSRVNLESDKPGTYAVRVNKPGYKEAIVNVIVYASTKQETTAAASVNEPILYGDYGFPIIPEDVVIKIIPDKEVTSVLTSSELTTDEERLAYLLKAGTFEDKVIIHTLCEVGEKTRDGRGMFTDEQGARLYQSVFNTLRNVINIEDTYSFQERFRLVIRIFKFYSKDSFTSVKLMRFDRGWTLGEESLVQFRMLFSFILKYIEKDGQNLDARLLSPYFDARVVDRIKTYCDNNIRP